MKLNDFDFVEAAGVRRAVVPDGDIRGDIAFQNDINGLLAGLDGGNPPLRALGWIREAVATPTARPVETAWRVIRGGGFRAKGLAAADQERPAAVARRA